MKRYRLLRSQEVSCPSDEVFRFYESAENLRLLTPPAVRLELLTPTPISMRAGTVIDYVLRVRGFGMHWRTLIAEYDPPHRFVDVQMKGPYAFWHHVHDFEATADGTRIIDDVHYALPFGPLGRLAHACFVKRELQSIFDYRERAITRHFAGEPPHTPRDAIANQSLNQPLVTEGDER